MTLSLTISQLIEKIPELKAGDRILLSGTIYTARDAAHARLVEIINSGGILPFKLENSVIYYCGPAPARPGSVIGSCGPTTSSRMDACTPLFLSRGVKATIGKGPRSKEVREALKEYKAVYLAATGGVAALMARTVKT
ncbi:MAG: fumarate hydratase C-terminal domain-containing protein, partial [Endomicrobiales bacterium]